MGRTLFAGAVALMLLSACVPVVKRNELRRELREAGFSAEQAQCLSDEIAPRLSIGELRELGRYVKTIKTSLRELPVPQAMARIVGEANPRTVGVLAAAGRSCIKTFAFPARARAQ